MLILRQFCLFPKRGLLTMNEEYGFTLIELILSMAIISILFLSFYSMLDFTTNTCKFGEENDEIMLNGQYAIEYIKGEIREAEKIISIDCFEGFKSEYKDNFGFVIMRYYPNEPYKYNYSTYYLKNNKIYRIAESREEDTLPSISTFSGHNLVAENVISIDKTNIDFDTKVVDLNFVLKGDLGKAKDFKAKIFIRCPVIY